MTAIIVSLQQNFEVVSVSTRGGRTEREVANERKLAASFVLTPNNNPEASKLGRVAMTVECFPTMDLPELGPVEMRKWLIEQLKAMME